MGSETILFVGAHYEVTNPGSGQTVTKYYFAGTTRVAMRKYIIPQSNTLTYLLGDHLGSTSLTVDAATSEIIETRYKAWGEVRYTTPNKTLPTRNTFTGQFSYVADEATDLGSAGFGLMFYNARWYDPAIGRFTQADSIVPPGVQGLDRYAYVNNSPLNYTDPSGHIATPCITVCPGDGGSGGSGGDVPLTKPEQVDSSNLSDYVYHGSGVSGRMMYDFYLIVWKANKGNLTIKQFIEMIMAHEFQPYQNEDGSLNFLPGSNFNEDLLKQTSANWFWGLNMGKTKVTSEAMLNWIAAFGSAGMAYRAGSLTGTSANVLAHEVIDYIYSIPGITRFDPTKPSTFGNLSMLPGLLYAPQGTGYKQYIAIWPNQEDDNPAYILSMCQVAYQQGDMEYVTEQC